eukprot:8525075-Lingulodinium_polyedra.AAC.1
MRRPRGLPARHGFGVWHQAATRAELLFQSPTVLSRGQGCSWGSMAAAFARADALSGANPPGRRPLR